MTKKTIKDLSAEFSLMKEEHSNLKTKYDTLAAKYENLEKKYEECCNKKTRTFKCNKCDEEFENLGVLNRHKKNHRTASFEMFECDDCKRCFDEEWKLSARVSQKNQKCSNR